MRTVRNVSFVVAVLLFLIGSQRQSFAYQTDPMDIVETFLVTHPECDNMNFYTYWIPIINGPWIFDGFSYDCDDVEEDMCLSNTWLYWDAQWACENACDAAGAYDYSFTHGFCVGECDCIH